MQEVVDPVACLRFVRVVNDRHHEPVAPLHVIYDTSLVELVDIDALSADDFKVSIFLVHIEICISIFSLE